MAINLNNIPVHNFRGSHTGLEKEGLRVTSSGYIAASPHPRGLGAPLTHPHITTDFAEAQMELITAAHRESERTLQQLYDLHAFVQQRLQDESLWPFSMPCRINSEQDIQIAQYGSSTTGMTKTIYRRGLAHRYGKSMQVIAGLHYNFSFSNALLETLYQGKSRLLPVHDPQHSKIRLAIVIPVWRISCDRSLLSMRQTAISGHTKRDALSALCNIPAHE
jgi:glutamate--cysteine ligase